MARKAPGKHYRKGLSLVQLMKLFPDDESAEKWFVQTRWPNGVCCPLCGSVSVQIGTTHPEMPYRCRDCRKYFSAKTGTLMQSSNLKYRQWAIAIYLMSTGIKGTSSMKLHRDLGITQKAAWHLSHRIRESWTKQNNPFAGPVEVDETFIGGSEKNKHENKKLRAGKGPIGKAIVAGIKDRKTNHISATVVPDTGRRTLGSFIAQRAASGAAIITDEHPGYGGLPNHTTVRHSIKEFVRNQAHTNGIESFWSLFKRAFHGTFHKMSVKHLDRYVGEFAGRHNMRRRDTIQQMSQVARGMDGKRLRFRDLIA